jgi:uncharacterized protein YwbE
MLPRFGWLLLLLFFAASARADIGIGDTREVVIQQLGQPTAKARRGEREILMYPHGGRVELVDGKVADVKGPLPAPIAPPAADGSATSNDSNSGTATPETTTPAAAPKAAASQATKSSSMPAVAPAPRVTPTTDAIGRQIEKMDTAWGQRPNLPQREPGINWPKLLVSIVLHFAATLFALRIAFKFWEMDALWKGTLAIAGIDLAVYTILELLGPVTSGLSTMSAVESGIGALVMVFTIQKFCFNKRLQNAVITAMAVKLVVRLCHLILFVFLLNALFG